MSKMDFLKIMGEIDDEVLERFYAVEPKIGIMAVRRRILRTLAPVCACLLIAASLFALPALISDADEGEPEADVTTRKQTTKKKTTRVTTANNPGDNVDSAPIWDYLSYPYAIVKILEVTDEKKDLEQVSQDFPSPYVKITCEVVYTYRVEGLSHYGYEPESFKTVNEIYVIESSVEEIAQYEMVLIDVVLMNMNGLYYYGPYTNIDGKADFLPFVDGKIVVDKDPYITFGSLADLNHEIEKFMDSTSEVGKALPKEKFANGMTLEQVTAFFDACIRAFEIRINSNQRNAYK